MWNANLVLALLLSKRPAPSFIVALYFPLVWLYNVLTAIKSDDVKSAFILNFQNIYNACVADSIFKHLNSLEFKALFSYFIIWPFPNALLIISRPYLTLLIVLICCQSKWWKTNLLMSIKHGNIMRRKLFEMEEHIYWHWPGDGILCTWSSMW